jgi:hypothetical protein
LLCVQTVRMQTAPEHSLQLSEDLTPLQIIRTETVLSRLPIHNLAKKGKVDIRITKRNGDGEVDLKWEVSHSDRYGQPRQLAYKVDTLIINRRIDEEGRPLAKIIRIGTLSQICRELGVPASGKNSNDLRRAMHQNAGAYITAKLTYRASDGTEKRLEAGFTRYGVAFTGDSLPDGRHADAIYIILNDPYRDVLNNAPVRPLNYDYLRELRPSGQRFYEIISYRIYAALKNNWPVAKLSYSDYCTFSAQQRYYDQEHFRLQMYKVHKAHLESGYLKSARYEAATDGEGKPDWTLFYEPGPKARAEFLAFTRRQSDSGKERIPLQGSVESTEQDSILKELIKRGISGSQAGKLVQGLAAGQQILDQLEWGDYLIRKAPTGSFRNPPGFYVWLIRDNMTPPDTFESGRKRQLREAAARERQESVDQIRQQELAYEDYCRAEVDRYLQENAADQALAMKIEARKQELAVHYKGLLPETLQEIALGAIRAELVKEVPALTYEQFCVRPPR